MSDKYKLSQILEKSNLRREADITEEKSLLTNSILNGLEKDIPINLKASPANPK